MGLTALAPYIYLRSVFIMMNGYVPWDVTKLTELYNWVSSAIGSATNVGVVALGIIVAIAIIVLVVRMFVK